MYAKKRSGKKVAAMLLAVVLLISVGVGGTLAWLSAQTNAVTNTFTVGNITIDLKEHKLNDDGTLDTTEEVTENNNYKVVPGGTQPKDPFVTVEQGSEKCYVYVLVTNNLVIDNLTVANPNFDNYLNWESIATNGNSTLYRHNAIVDASTSKQPLQIFSEIKYADTITKDTITQLKDKTIVIDAFAHQSDNTDQDTADAAAKAHFGFTTTNP